MAETHVISALKRKRARIAGELVKSEKRCNAMREYLAALDNTLRIFDYDGDPANIKPVKRRRRLFRHGELSRAVMDVLRAAEGPLIDAELVDRVMAAKALDAENVDLRRTITERVKAVRKRLDTAR